MLNCRSSPWQCRNRAGTWSVGCPVHANRKGIVCEGLCFWRVQDKLHTTSTRHWKNVTMNTHESWSACLSTSWSKKCWFIVVKISGCKLADMEITRQPAVYCFFSLKVQQCYIHRKTLVNTADWSVSQGLDQASGRLQHPPFQASHFLARCLPPSRNSRGAKTLVSPKKKVPSRRRAADQVWNILGSAIRASLN